MRFRGILFLAFLQLIDLVFSDLTKYCFVCLTPVHKNDPPPEW